MRHSGLALRISMRASSSMMRACAEIEPLFSAHAHTWPVCAVQVELLEFFFILRADLRTNTCKYSLVFHDLRAWHTAIIGKVHTCAPTRSAKLCSASALSRPGSKAQQHNIHQLHQCFAPTRWQSARQRKPASGGSCPSTACEALSASLRTM